MGQVVDGLVAKASQLGDLPPEVHNAIECMQLTVGHFDSVPRGLAGHGSTTEQGDPPAFGR
jgi:hypothetical protein